MTPSVANAFIRRFPRLDVHWPGLLAVAGAFGFRPDEACTERGAAVVASPFG